MPVTRILHIDDEKDVLDKVRKIVSAQSIGENKLEVIDSCDFNEGIEKLRERTYDLVILDLCVGNATDPGEKIGEAIFKQIQSLTFVPIVFFTGLPDLVKGFESDIVKAASKIEGYDSLFEKIEALLNTGFIKIKSDIDNTIREGIRSYFWSFVHPNSKKINEIIKDDVSLKFLLLRRLAKSLSNETLKKTIEDVKVNTSLSHPMEFYIYPPVEGEFETGDIITQKATGFIYVILTPACDLILRNDGQRKAIKILLVRAFKFKSLVEFKKYMQLVSELAGLKEKQKKLKESQIKELDGAIKTAESKVNNQVAILKNLMKPKNDQYFFLPETPFLEAMLIDFQHKSVVLYKDLDANFDSVATLDDPFSQSMQSSFTRYYNRVGFPDLDIDYAFSKLI